MAYTNPATGITIPDVGDPGTPYAQEVSDAINRLCNITHTGPENNDGYQLNQNALDFTGDLPLNGFNLIDVRSVRYVNETTTLTGVSDQNIVYVVNGNLYFNNAAGTPIPITTGGSVYPPIMSVSFVGKNVNSNLTILPTDTYNLLDVNSSSGSITIQLPVAATVSPYRYYFFNDVGNDSETNSITFIIAGGSGNTIQANGSTGLTSVSLPANGMSGLLYTDGVATFYMMFFQQSVFFNQTLQFQGTSIIQMQSGSILDVQSGGILDLDSGSTTNINGSVFLDNSGNITVSGSGVIDVSNSTGLLATSNSAVIAAVSNSIKSNATNGIVSAVPQGITPGVQHGISGNIAIGITADAVEGIASEVFGGIQPMVSGGIVSNATGGIESTSTNGGIYLGGGNNDYVTFGHNGAVVPRTFTFSFPIGNLIPYTLGIGLTPWVNNGQSVTGVINTGVIFGLPMIHNGATLTSVTLKMSNSIGSRATPATPAAFAVLGYPIADGTSPATTFTIGTATAPAVLYTSSGANYCSMTASCNSIINTSLNSYQISLDEESSTNAHANQYWFVVLNYTISNMQFAL